MSYVIINARLKSSHYGQLHPFKDAGLVADSLTGVRNAIVSCLFVVNRNYIHKGFTFPHR
jgi:hypothetical protein